VDFLLTESDSDRPIYLEVKSTTWAQGRLALFPGSCRVEVWGCYTKLKSSRSSAVFSSIMKCPLCGHEKSHRHGKTSKGSQRYFCPKCRQTFTDTFDTLYFRRQVSSEDVRIVLQSHAEGSSLRGISRISGLAYDTVVNIVQAAALKAQMVHNAEVQDVDTDAINADELWSFVQKNKSSAYRKNSKLEIAG
jgi:transposase-like protein